MEKRKRIDLEISNDALEFSSKALELAKRIEGHEGWPGLDTDALRLVRAAFNGFLRVLEHGRSKTS